MPSPEPASFQLNPGDRVGNYVIREQIGEGGFAIVYAAEQEKPVRRKVALKIIKLGMDTKRPVPQLSSVTRIGLAVTHPLDGKLVVDEDPVGGARAREAVLAGGPRTFDLTPSHEELVGAMRHTAIASLNGTRPRPPTAPGSR